MQIYYDMRNEKKSKIYERKEKQQNFPSYVDMLCVSNNIHKINIYQRKKHTDKY